MAPTDAVVRNWIKSGCQLHIERHQHPALSYMKSIFIGFLLLLSRSLKDKILSVTHE